MSATSCLPWAHFVLSEYEGFFTATAPNGGQAESPGGGWAGLYSVSFGSRSPTHRVRSPTTEPHLLRSDVLRPVLRPDGCRVSRESRVLLARELGDKGELEGVQRLDRPSRTAEQGSIPIAETLIPNTSSTFSAMKRNGERLVCA